MTRFTSALLFGLLATLPTTAAERYVGYAYAEDSGELVYIERHSQTAGTRSPSRLDTRYTTPEGRLIASRAVRFVDPLRPSFELTLADGRPLEGLDHRIDGLRVYRRDPADNALDSTTLRSDQVDVADAGFVRFIQIQWEALVAGNPLEFDFLVPSRLDAVPMRLRLHERVSVLDEPAMTFRLAPANPVLRWFVDPIDISFHAERRELLRYRGLSNIPRDDQGNHVVRIDFPPGERQRAVADERLVANTFPASTAGDERPEGTP
jgi:hypothetical protein